MMSYVMRVMEADHIGADLVFDVPEALVDASAELRIPQDVTV